MTIVTPETLEQAIAILGAEELTEEMIESKVAELVTDPMTARRLIDCIPEAFGIVMVCEKWEVEQPATFSAKSSSGRWQDFKFREEPIFIAALRVARHMYHNGPEETFDNIALRSSVMDCVSEALRAGESLKGSVLSGPAMIGIPAEIYQQ